MAHKDKTPESKKLTFDSALFNITSKSKTFNIGPPLTLKSYKSIKSSSDHDSSTTFSSLSKDHKSKKKKPNPKSHELSSKTKKKKFEARQKSISERLEFLKEELKETINIKKVPHSVNQGNISKNSQNRKRLPERFKSENHTSLKLEKHKKLIKEELKSALKIKSDSDSDVNPDKKGGQKQNKKYLEPKIKTSVKTKRRKTVKTVGFVDEGSKNKERSLRKMVDQFRPKGMSGSGNRESNFLEKELKKPSQTVGKRWKFGKLSGLKGVFSRNLSLETVEGRGSFYVFTINGNRYLARKQIGRGGYSNVYKATSSATRKNYAIKHIHIKDPSVTTNFAREIQILDNEKIKREKSIIRLVEYESDNENSHLFMVFEIAESDMAKFLRANAPLSLEQARYFWGQMVDAVRVLHKLRIIHKDLKPQNFVLVNASVKLIDFGLADTVPEFTTHIHNEKTEGTPSYMAPECFRSSEDRVSVSRGTDIWSLGIILFEMLVGHTPFHNLNSYAKSNAIVNNVKMPLDLIKDPLLLELIKSCLRRSPHDRPSAEDLMEHPFLSICRNNCSGQFSLKSIEQNSVINL